MVGMCWETIITIIVIMIRTDVENYDIEELYEFADATGILERHKALLSQPFNESQVCHHHCHCHHHPSSPH